MGKIKIIAGFFVGLCIGAVLVWWATRPGPDIVTLTLRDNSIVALRYGNEDPLTGGALQRWLDTYLPSLKDDTAVARQSPVPTDDEGEFQFPTPVACGGFPPANQQSPRCCTRDRIGGNTTETARNILFGPKTGQPRFQAPGGSAPENEVCTDTNPYG